MSTHTTTPPNPTKIPTPSSVLGGQWPVLSWGFVLKKWWEWVVAKKIPGNPFNIDIPHACIQKIQIWKDVLRKRVVRRVWDMLEFSWTVGWPDPYYQEVIKLVILYGCSKCSPFCWGDWGSILVASNSFGNAMIQAEQKAIGKTPACISPTR